MPFFPEAPSGCILKGSFEVAACIESMESKLLQHCTDKLKQPESDVWKRDKVAVLKQRTISIKH